jgi:alpha-amylase
MNFKEGGSEELPLVKGKTARPWNLAFAVKDSGSVEALTPAGSLGDRPIHNVMFDPLTNSVTFEIDKSVLKEQGWKEDQPLFIQGYTTADDSGIIADSLGARQRDSRGNLAGGIDLVKEAEGIQASSGPSDAAGLKTMGGPTEAGGAAVDPREVRHRRWEDEIIYWCMTDRFYNGDKSNDFNTDPKDINKFHGGDWQGIIDKLDYIRDMGFTTLWISPATQNDKDFFGMDGYHGYWPHDFFKTEESFGTMEKLQELVTKAHEKGIKVVLDLVLNHVGYNNPIGTDPGYHDWFHHIGNTMFIDPYSMEHGSFRGLPDFAQENPEVADYLKKMGQWWQEKTGIDAYRIDAAKHMPKSFLKDFSAHMHEVGGNGFATIGEAYFGNPRPLSRYQKKAGMDLLFDTPMVDVIRNTMTADSSESRLNLFREAWKSFFLHPYDTVRNLRKIFNPEGAKGFSRVFKEDARYDNPDHLVTFIDNHDMSRFLTIAGKDAMQKFRLALTFLMTARGVPSVYYGTEDAMGLEPATYDRADKKWNNDPETAAFLKSLTHLRSGSPALRRGRQVELFADKEVYAFSRVHPKEEFVVVLNCSDIPQEREIPMMVKSKIPKDCRLTDRLTGKVYEVKDGRLSVPLEPKAAAVLSFSRAAAED